MKRYTDPDKPQYVFHVRACLNGYAIQLLIVERDENIPLTQQVASQLGVNTPNPYRLQSCTREEAENVLDELAALNGWVAAVN